MMEISDEGTEHQIPNVVEGIEQQIPNGVEGTEHQIPNVDEGTEHQIPNVDQGTEHQIPNVENNTMECEQIIEVENPQGQKNIIILVDRPIDSNSTEQDAEGSKTVDFYSSEPGVLVMDESSQGSEKESNQSDKGSTKSKEESNQLNKGSTKSEKENSQTGITGITDNSNDTSQTIEQSENFSESELHEKSVDVDSTCKPEIEQDVAGTSSSQMDDSEPGLCTPETETNEEKKDLKVENEISDEKIEEEKDMTDENKEEENDMTEEQKDDMSEKQMEEEKDMTEEEAQEILMKALQKISPKIGKDFVLMFKDPSTSKVKEFSSDKGRKFLQHNTDVVKKFSNVVSGKKTTTSEESTSKREGHSRSEDDNTVMESDHETDSEAEDKSPVKKGKNIKKKMVEIKPVKRVPRTSVIMKKLAKLDEKERMKNLQVFSCKECSSKFGTMGNLNKHMKNKHNTDDEGKSIPKVNDSDNSLSDMIEHPNNEKMETNLNETNKSLDVIKKVKDEKNVEFMMKDCGDFETVVSVSDYVDPPGDISDDDSEITNTSRVKRGRGRPPKPKNPFLEPKTPEENKSNDVVTRGRGRPRKSTGISSPKDTVTEVNKKSKTEKNSKISYTDEDMDCFIRTVEEENTRMNLECKLCLLRFSSHRMAREHIVQEHYQNLIQCTKTLEKFPDTTKTSRWDNHIYYIEDEIKEEIIPSELFTSVARGGRKRTPSKNYWNQHPLLEQKYMFHIDELPEKSEDSGEEEEEEEEQQEESDEEMEVNDEDLDYKPTHKAVEDNEEETIKKTKGRGRKRKQQSNVEPLESEHKKIKNEKDQEKTKEVHVKIEVVEDENSHVQTNENVAENEDLPTNEEADESKDDVVMDEDATDNSSMTVKKNTLNRKPKFINNRSRAKTFKKVPSYYKYCDHSEEHIIKKSTQQLPFCKTCDRFKCMTCTLTFNKSSHVNRHVRIIHNKEKKYKCPTCEACFTTNESLQYHAKWHTGVKDVECPYCDMKFLVHKNLRKHMNKHHPGLISKRRKKTNYCEICDSIFTRKDRLEYHMLEKHPANNPDRECRICGQKFETDMDCTEHSNAHADMKKVPVAKCPHCPLYCSSKNNLKRHVDRVHLNIKKYLCNECGKRFKGRDAYLYHAKRHVDPFGRDFECHICSKKIATEKGLEIHLRVHTGAKPFVCETCGKGFAQKGNMLSHQAIHFDDRPFECEECHKTFKKKFDLYKHKKRHKVKHTVATGDVTFLEGAGKIYNCPLDDCDGIFCSTTDLRLHMRRHNNEKPYECSICFKSFAVKSRLVRHLRNVHSLTLPDSNLESMKDPDFLKKIENAREIYEDRKRRFQTVMIPQPSGEQIEVQIMTEDTEGVEDLLALSNATTFHKDVVKEETAEEEDQNEEIHLKIETSEDNEGGVQIINVREDSSGEVQIHTEDENIVLDPAIIQTLLNSGQQTIYYYVDQ
ncbi:KRAB [Mytilus edulis]|uniref:KRAB n=1 Tax=Mytilus edulis TaxID=6550 RepID=A0A8S3VIV4_MYTED|nr:KRAB [Mytilus edulis]